MAGDARPLALLAGRYTQIHLCRLQMKVLNFQRTEVFFDDAYLLVYLFPFSDRIGRIQVTALDHLRRVLLERHFCLPGQFVRGENAERPGVLAQFLTLIENVLERLAGDNGLADFGRINIFEVSQRLRRVQVYSAIDIFVEFFVAGGDKGKLSGVGLLIEAELHAAGGGQALHRTHTAIEDPPIENFGKRKCRQVILDKDDFIFFHGDFPGRLQRPEEHIGIFLQIFCSEHILCFPSG